MKVNKFILLELKDKRKETNAVKKWLRQVEDI